MRNIVIIVVPEKPQVDVAAREIFSTELDAITPGVNRLVTRHRKNIIIFLIFILIID